MKLKYLLSAGLALALTACALPALATAPEVSRSDFDGATRVQVDAHGVKCGWTDAACPMLGAQWTSAEPQLVMLDVELYNGRATPMTLTLMLDGERVVLPASAIGGYERRVGSGTPQTWRAFACSRGILDAIVAARDVKVRVGTRLGNYDGGVTGSKAGKALQQFAVEVRRQSAAQTVAVK